MPLRPQGRPQEGSSMTSGAPQDDLRAFPGNHLEALAGDRKGQHSIRINDQYRICFVWKDGEAKQVEVVEYH
jgi:proteic killer suppression protein